MKIALKKTNALATVLFVFFIVANLSGCSMSAAEIKENPAGHSISDVIISWGAPNLTAVKFTLGLPVTLLTIVVTRTW